MDRVDNAIFLSDSVIEAKQESELLFVDKQNKLGSQIISLVDPKNDNLLLNNPVELAYVIISPSLVKTNEFVYVLDDFYRSKFIVSAMKKRSVNR